MLRSIGKQSGKIIIPDVWRIGTDSCGPAQEAMLDGGAHWCHPENTSERCKCAARWRWNLSCSLFHSCKTALACAARRRLRTQESTCSFGRTDTTDRFTSPAKAYSNKISWVVLPRRTAETARSCTTINIRYDTIRHAILTCARKPTWVSLIYRTETTTKRCKTEKKLRSKNGHAQK